ncbi:carbohydrate kinase [Subtercola sp. Z020]|uniref:FGGY family carbohydrate kinase n=1 Tax=Subtercola sp. Z020 TaxID=2080582 RepID=UPI000CE7242B|nr:FGGY family carbohydrate kinase [Subtercola sp. Z020]PPF76989.1 carbohydrate kinase [Subtercola sp. Z020]
MSVVLGIDLATGDARVLAVDAETGEHLAERSTALPTTSTAWQNGATREQPAVYAEAVFGLIRAVVGALGPRSADIAALSTTGTSGTVVPTDADGRPSGNALLYNDPRGTAEAAALAGAGLGIRPSAALARAGWMHAHTPAARYLFTPDVVAAALAGEVLPSDTSHALKSGIDPVAASWNDRAVELVRIPLASLPSLVAPGRAIGVVSPAVAASLGLPAGVLIVSGMTDGSTAQLATGAVRPGDTVGVLGTTLVLKAASAAQLTDGASGIYSHVAPDGTFWAGGASNTGAGVLRHGLTAGLDVREADRAAVELGVSPVVSYPLAGRGERFPVVDAAFGGFDVNLAGAPYSYGAAGAGAWAEPAVVRFRAVLEGVAFVERLGIERLAALAAAGGGAAGGGAAAGGAASDAHDAGSAGDGGRRGFHHLGGGASGSTVWNTIRASVLGRPVVVPGNRSSAFGAAMLAAAGLPGETFQGVIDRLASPGRFVDPDPALVPALSDRYALFGETLVAELDIALPGASRTDDHNRTVLAEPDQERVA